MNLLMHIVISTCWNRTSLWRSRQLSQKNELDAYVESTPAALSPLSKLSPPARERFLASITFNEKGITGFRHDDLQVELSPSEIYRVLSLFGAQHTTALFKRARSETPADAAIMEPLMQTAPQSGPLCPSQPCDYDGYMCESRATCAPNINTICMRNC